MLHGPGLERVESDRLELPADHVDREGRLEAAAVAAATPGAGGIDLRVADLAGHAVRPAIEPPVQDERGADAIRRLDVDEVSEIAGRPVGHLAQGAEGGIVAERERQPDAAA